MEIKHITSISEYVGEICAVTQTYMHDFPLRYEVPLFRGQPDVSFPLLPSIARGRSSSIDISIFNEERNLIEMAKIRMPTVFKKDLEPIELLALLQHHGIPTRMLDVTENSLVALYFACCDEKCSNKDGEVIVFKDTQNNIGNYPIVQAIADSYRICGGASLTASIFLNKAKNFDYFREQQYLIQLMSKNSEAKHGTGKSTEFDSWMLGISRSPLFIYAPFSSLRQKMQQGRYILFQNDVEVTDKGIVSIEPMISEIPKNHSCIAARIQVDALSKGKILQQLSLFGISRQTLFPDSTDVVCEEIKKDALARIQSSDERIWDVI